MAAVDSKRTNNEELLNLAIQSAKRGDKEAARNLLRRVWDSDKRNERAMLWMAKLARNPKEQREWLTRILQNNPDNEAAKKALEHMQHSHAARENRILLMFGAVAVVMFVLILAILIIAFM